jgi:hypothetical protein
MVTFPALDLIVVPAGTGPIPVFPAVIGLIRSYFFLGPYGDSEIRTMQFTESAVGAFFRADDYCLALVVQFQDLARAEGHAYAASLAPVPIHSNLGLTFLFTHILLIFLTKLQLNNKGLP